MQTRKAGKMPALPDGWHSRGYLPHFDGVSLPQMITFRLADSLPKELLDAWSEELKRLPERQANVERRRRIESYLDKGEGKAFLRDSQIAQLVQDALLYFNNARYTLHAWVIMPNHVHALLTTAEKHRLSNILHSWKSYTAKQSNKLLKRTGDFWQEESFDRYIRNQRHFAAAINYIEENPVKAGLCRRKEDWKFSSAYARAQNHVEK